MIFVRSKSRTESVRLLTLPAQLQCLYRRCLKPVEADSWVVLLETFVELIAGMYQSRWILRVEMMLGPLLA